VPAEPTLSTWCYPLCQRLTSPWEVHRKTSSSASAPPPARVSAEESVMVEVVVVVEARQTCRRWRPRRVGGVLDSQGRRQNFLSQQDKRRHSAYVDTKRERGVTRARERTRTRARGTRTLALLRESLLSQLRESVLSQRKSGRGQEPGEQQEKTSWMTTKATGVCACV
jgi:hypothetical protein